MKLFDFSKFSELFGTAMLAFLMHHSIPQMLRPLKPDSDIKYTISLSKKGSNGFVFLCRSYLYLYTNRWSLDLPEP
jgi:hypothetical protein